MRRNTQHTLEGTLEETHCFITHNWSNGNHERVAIINEALKKRGVKTWFDSGGSYPTYLSTLSLASISHLYLSPLSLTSISNLFYLFILSLTLSFTEKMTGAMRKMMSLGIEHTRTFIVIITREYMNKVNSDRNGGGDNCKYEFRYAMDKIGPNNFIPVVMEKDMCNQLQWTGEFGGCVCNTLFLDFSDEFNLADGTFDAKIDSLVLEITNRVGVPLPVLK